MAVVDLAFFSFGFRKRIITGNRRIAAFFLRGNAGGKRRKLGENRLGGVELGVWQIGEVAERLNAADLKSADGGAVRGFESLPLRRIFLARTRQTLAKFGNGYQLRLVHQLCASQSALQG